jgi:hypothetical protein
MNKYEDKIFTLRVQYVYSCTRTEFLFPKKKGKLTTYVLRVHVYSMILKILPDGNTVVLSYPIKGTFVRRYLFPEVHKYVYIE